MKFKVGDRVIGIGMYSNRAIDKKSGTVQDVSDTCAVVEFDDKNFNGWGSSGRCWGVPFERLRPANIQKEIRITASGNTTLAELYDGEKVIKSAQAKCAPSDTFDFATGAKLAFERLIREPKAEPEPKPEPIKLYCVKDNKPYQTKGKVYELSNGNIQWDNFYEECDYRDFQDYASKNTYLSKTLVPLVKRPAKVGEWIHITESRDSRAKVGHIYKFVDNDCGIFVEHPEGRRKEDGAANISPSKYLVLDGYQPEPEKPKEPEYLNMKVVCTKGGFFHTEGKVYEVKDGILSDNSTSVYNNTRHKTLKELNADLRPQFIEFKGHA